MATFRFDFDIKANYQDVSEAKKELLKMNELIEKAQRPENRVHVNTDDLQRAMDYAKALERAIKETEKNGKSVSANLRTELEKAKRSSQDTEAAIKGARNESNKGSSGESFRTISKAAKIATQDIKATDTQLDRLKRNIQEGIGQTIAFGAIGAVSAAIGSSVSEVVKLDKVMNQLSIVSGQTRAEMEKFRDAAFEASDKLGATAREYLEASLIYKQQGGLASQYSEDLAKATVLGANIDDTGNDAQQISEYMTAVMNGFDMLKDKGGETGMYIMDVLSKLGAVSGSSLGEMAEGLQRTSNIARLSGYDFEEIASAIAVVSETTRRSAATIGNGFKSILVSFQQLREAGDEEVEAFSNKIEQTFRMTGMEGVSIFDNGNLRDAKDIMDDIGDRWKDMNKEQQSMISEAIAGKYQAEVFQAFMENQERYKELIGDAYDSAGIAAQQQLVYMDSIESKTKALKNAWQSASTSLINTDVLKDVIDQATVFLSTIGGINNELGSMGVIAAPILGIFSQMFGGRFAAEMSQNKTVKNLQQQVMETIQGYDHLSSKQKEVLAQQSEYGERQRVVLENLGGSAASAYRNAQDELRSLKEQQVELLEMQEKMESPEDILGKLKGGGYKNYDQGRFAQYDAAAKEAVKERFAEEISGIEESKQRYSELFDGVLKHYNSFDKTVEKGSRTRQDVISNYKGHIFELINTSRQMTNTLGFSESKQAELSEGRRRLNKLFADSNVSQGELNKAIQEHHALLREAGEEMKKNAQISQRDYEQRIADELKLQDIKSQMQEKGLDVEGTERRLGEIEEQTALLQATSEALEEGAGKAAKWKRSVELIGGAMTSLGPIVGGYIAMLNGAISEGEMMRQSINSISAALLMSGNPYAMAGGAVLGLIGQFKDFRSEAEKVKDANEDIIRTFVSTKEQVYDARTAVAGIEEEYKAFSGVDVPNLLENGDTEDIERYIRLSETISNVAPELVKYYDSQGRAIIDLTHAYEDLADVKREDVRLANELMVDNQSNFISQASAEISDANTRMAVATAGLQKAKEDLQRAQETGNDKAASEALARIQETTSQLQAARDEISELGGFINANIVRPLLEGNEALDTMVNSQNENLKKIGQNARELLSEQFSSGFIQDMLGAGLEDELEGMMSSVGKLMERELEKFNSGSKSKPYEGMKISAEELSAALVAASGDAQTLDDIISGKTTTGQTFFNDLAEDTKKLAELSDDGAKSVEGMGKKVETTGKVIGTLTGAVVAGGVALAPFTGGLSLAATAAVSAGAGLAGYATGLASTNIAFGKTGKAMKKLADQEIAHMKTMGKVSATYRELTKTTEGYNKAVGDLKGIRKAQKGLKNLEKEIRLTGKVNRDLAKDSSFQELLAIYPELQKKYSETSMSHQEMAESIMADVRAMAAQEEAMLYGMTLDNMEYFDRWKERNIERTEFALEQYGIDAANYQTMAEYKEAIEEISTARLAVMYERKTEKATVEYNEMFGAGARSAWGTSVAWAGSIGTTIDNFDYMSSEALTMSDKVSVGVLMIVDALANTVILIVNLVVSAIAGLVNSINEALTIAYNGFKGLVKGAINAYNVVADLIPGMERAEGSIYKWASEKAEAKQIDPSQFQMKYKDWSGEYARNKISQRTSQAEKAKADLTRLDGDLALDMLDAGSLGAGGGGGGSIPTIGGKRPAPSSSGSDKGGGGKKGGKDKKGKDKKGKKEKEKKDVENLELELDRYYKLENALSVMENKLTEVGRRKDEAFGQDRVKAMEDEQKQLAAQEKTLSKYILALQKEQQEKKGILANRGFQFDSQGEITNLNERLKALQDAANRKTGEAKEKAIADVKKLQEEAARYTEITFNLIPDKDKALKDARSAIKAIEREKVEYKVQLRVDKEEFAQSVRDVMKELNDDNYDKLDESSVIASTQLRDHMAMVKFYEDKIKEVQANTGLTDADRNALVQEYKNSMLSSISDAKSSYDELSEYQQEFVNQSVEMIEQISENFDNIYEKADRVAEAFMNVYGSSAYAEVDRFRVAQIKSLDAQVKALSQAKSEMEFYLKSIPKGTEEWKLANEAVQNLGNQIEESLVQRIELLKQRFEEFMEGLMEETDRSIFGSLGLDEYEEQLEKLLEKNDKMLNTYEKITKIGGLMAEVNEAIANATDPADAEAYKKFREQELETLMKADKVSEDELERAKLLWEIRQKEQALEDRRNAQRMAQLVRDENGNMSYEYVMGKNDSDTNSGMKDLTDAKNSLYEFDNERIQEANRNILAIIASTNDKIQAIYENSNLSEAEKKAALEKAYNDAKIDIGEAQEDIIKWAGYAMTDGISDLKHAFQNNKVSFEPMGVDDSSIQKVFDAMDSGNLTVSQMLSGDVADFAASVGMTVEEATSAIGAIIGATSNESSRYSQEIIDRSNEWLNATHGNLETLANNYGKTQSEIDRTTNILENSTGNLTHQIDKNSQAADKNAEEIRKQTIDMIASGKATDSTTQSFKDLTNALVGSGGGGTLGAMVKIREDMNKKLQASLRTTKQRSDELSKSTNITAKELQNMGVRSDYAFKMTRQFDSGTIRTANDNIQMMATRADSAANRVQVLGDNADISRQKIATLSVALAALPGLDSGKRHYYTITKKDGSVENVSYDKKPSKMPAGGNYVGYFDTGGYTGEWTGSSGNQEGKFLMAHEKELVLNKEDTENFLEGIQIQRELVRAIGGGMSNVVAATLASKNEVINNNNNSQSSQKIHVEANFPNATNANEIERALANLSLNATSYAYRK